MTPLKKGIEANNLLKMQINTGELCEKKEVTEPKATTAVEKSRLGTAQGENSGEVRVAPRAVDYLLRKQQI